MANRQVYPSSLFPLRGDISAEAGATTVTVTGLQGIPIISPPVEPVGGDTLFYDDYNNDWYYASPWSLPVGTVLEWEGYGYSPAGISWLAPDTLAVGNGTPGDVSGAAAMTALILFSAEQYDAPYGSYYEDFYTTFYSGATQNWNLTFPAGPGLPGQVLTTDGTGITSWTTVTSGSGFLYTVTDQTTTYAANSGDDVWCTGTFTVTLPVLSVTQRVKVRNAGTGVITVVPTSGLINGGSSLTLARQYSSCEFSGDGTNVGIE